MAVRAEPAPLTGGPVDDLAWVGGGDDGGDADEPDVFGIDLGAEPPEAHWGCRQHKRHMFLFWRTFFTIS